MLVDVKSRAGRRTVVLPDPLFDLLTAHMAAQEKEREHAGTEWHDDGFMFAQENGKPIDPRNDWDEWKSLLKEAGVRDSRLHDARHTAASVLLLLGVPERAVLGFMGWSNSALTSRYQHMTSAVHQDIAARIGRHLWDLGEPPDRGE
jgi:integrase